MALLGSTSKRGKYNFFNEYILLTRISESAKLVIKTLVTVCMALLRQTTTIQKNKHCTFDLMYIFKKYLRTTSALPVIPKKNISA